MISRKALQRRKRLGEFMLRRSLYWGWEEGFEEELQDRARIGMWGTTRTPCSCWMCGNPRRHLKGEERLTLQERKNIEAWKDFEAYLGPR